MSEFSGAARPLKVLFIVEAAATGVARHLFYLLDGLTARGHQVDVLYSPLREDDLFRRNRAQRPDVTFRPIAMRRPPHPADARALWQIRRHLRAFGPYDIIHGHSSKGGMLARLAAVGTSSRVVYTAHAISTLDPTLGRWKRLIFHAGEWGLSWLTDAIIAVSARERDEIVRLGIPARKVRVILNAVDPLPPGPDMRAELGLAAEDVAIGFVGRCSYQKAIDVLVAAFAQVWAETRRARLVVIGSGEGEAAARQQAEAAGCGAGILWQGERDALACYRSFDLLAVPSRYDSTSYTLLEAASAGLPIVATDVAGVQREIVEDGVTGTIVPPGDAPALARALLALVLDDERRHRYAAARRVAGGGLNRMVEDTVALYRALPIPPSRRQGA